MRLNVTRSALAAAALALVVPTLSLPSGPAEGTLVAQGTAATGAQGLETRNEPIRVDAGAVIAGPVVSRNGRITIGEGADVGLVDTRNGRIEIGARSVVRGTVESRNGRIDLASGVHVEGGVESRNGAIELGDGVRVAGSAESRNGRIRLGPAGVITGSASTRNGAVELSAGSVVEGDVMTRNGAVRLRDARVARNVDVMNGDVELRGSSRIEGDLIVLMPEDRGWSWFSFGRSTAGTPVVRIDADAYVGGRLIVDERARLEIAPGADVPEPERFPSREAWAGGRQ